MVTLRNQRLDTTLGSRRSLRSQRLLRRRATREAAKQYRAGVISERRFKRVLAASAGSYALEAVKRSLSMARG